MQPVSGVLSGGAVAGSGAQAENRRIEKSSREFESLLLSNWLEKAYDSFGSMPGAEDDGDLDSGKEQMSSLAMQSLGAAMTASGGVGIAKMIANHLYKHADAAAEAPGSQMGQEGLKRISLQDAELSARTSR